MGNQKHDDVTPQGVESPGIERLRRLKVVGPDEETLQKIQVFVTKYPVAYLQGFITRDGAAFHICCLVVHKEHVTDEMRQEFLSVTVTAPEREHQEDLLAEWFPTSPAVDPGRPNDVHDFVFRGEKVECKGFGSHMYRLLVWPSSTPTDEV